MVTTTSTTITQSITTSEAETTLTTKTTITQSSTVNIWAPIVAVAGTIIICLLIFFAVRHLRTQRRVNTENQSGYQIPYAEAQYEQPYRSSDGNGDNDTDNFDNEEIYEDYHSERDSIEYETYEHAEYAEYKIKNKK